MGLFLLFPVLTPEVPTAALLSSPPSSTSPHMPIPEVPLPGGQSSSQQSKNAIDRYTKGTGKHQPPPPRTPLCLHHAPGTVQRSRTPRLHRHTGTSCVYFPLSSDTRSHQRTARPGSEPTLPRHSPRCQPWACHSHRPRAREEQGCWGGCYLSTAGHLHTIHGPRDLDGLDQPVLAALIPHVLHNLLILLIIQQLLRQHHVHEAQDLSRVAAHLHLRAHQARDLQGHRSLVDGALWGQGQARPLQWAPSSLPLLKPVPLCGLPRGPSSSTCMPIHPCPRTPKHPPGQPRKASPHHPPAQAP